MPGNSQYAIVTIPGQFFHNAYRLPLATRMIEGDIGYSSNAARAVESDTWVALGDRRANPTKTKLEIQLNAPTELAARALVTAIETNARACLALIRVDAQTGGAQFDVSRFDQASARFAAEYRQPILGLEKMTFKPIGTSWRWALTLEFTAGSRFWSDQPNGLSQFLF